MDTDIKKEEDIKTEPKGIKSYLNIAICRITFAINIRGKNAIIIFESFHLENEKDEKVNPTNEEAKKDGGANP